MANENIDFSNLDKVDLDKIDFENLTPEQMDKVNEYIDGCTGNCESCGAGCNQITPKISTYCSVLVSAKGGTGRSTMTALLASALRRRGLTVGIIDADIATPAIPYLFGVSTTMPNDGEKVTPVDMGNGVVACSMGLIGQDNDEPCLLGCKESASIAAFFWSGAKWEMPDCVLIDAPAGIGDIPLELFTVLPIDDVIVVTNPGTLCAKMARKVVSLVKMLLMPIRGVIENKSNGVGSDIALLNDEKLRLLAKVPTDSAIFDAANSGTIAQIEVEAIERLADEMAEDILSRK